MRIGVATIAALSSLLTAGAALAATVDSIKGDVSINRGAGFVKLTGPATANVGDSLMAGPDGGAQLVYSPECVVQVVPGSVVFVADESPCQTQVEGGYQPTGGSLKDDVVEQPRDYRPYVVGAAVVGVIACVTLCDHDDDGASDD